MLKNIEHKFLVSRYAQTRGKHANDDRAKKTTRRGASFTGVVGTEAQLRSSSACATMSRTEGSARFSSDVAAAGPPNDSASHGSASYGRQGWEGQEVTASTPTCQTATEDAAHTVT